MSEISHNCGLVVAHTLHDVYSFIRSLGHRGREAAGIAAIGETIDVVKWRGRVIEFDLDDLHKIFQGHDYHTYMAHVRYATSGRKDKILEDAHPHTIGGVQENRGNHIVIKDCEIAGVHNGQVDDQYLSGIDRKRLQTGCDTEALLHFYKQHGPYEILKKIPGSYTLAIADRNIKSVIVLRDRTGIKPGMLGFKDGKYGVASEDVAFRENGGKFFEELDPGTIYYLSQNGSYTKEPVVQPALAHCFFEWNYIADLESRVNRIDTRTVRENLGVILAEEFHPPDADLVTFLPRCPEVAAEWYAKTLKQYHPHLPLELFKPIFYKMKGERAFQGSTKEERRESINRNLFLLPGMNEHLRNKRVILVDDSIIRGNNIERARSLLYDEAHVQEAIFLSYTPPIGIMGNDGVPRGCMFGVDMPPNDSFIAREKNLEEISKAVGMKVIYISQQGMLEAFRRSGLQNPEKTLCAYCIGGRHPFKQE